MVQVPAHTRRKKSVKEQLPKEIPVVERHHYVDEAGRTCPHCSAELVEIGTEISETLGMAPAKIFVIRDVAHIYACKECEKEAEAVTIRKATLPAAVIPGGMASLEAIANIINDKFVQGTPLYRQEQYWNRQNVMLSRQTMSNWLRYNDWNSATTARNGQLNRLSLDERTGFLRTHPKELRTARSFTHW